MNAANLCKTKYIKPIDCADLFLNADFSDLIPEPTLQRTIQAARGSAQDYAQRLIDFLNDNSTTYPEWETSCNFRGRINKTGTAYLGAVRGNKSIFKRNIF